MSCLKGEMIIHQSKLDGNEKLLQKRHLTIFEEKIVRWRFLSRAGAVRGTQSCSSSLSISLIFKDFSQKSTLNLKSYFYYAGSCISDAQKLSVIRLLYYQYKMRHNLL